MRDFAAGDYYLGINIDGTPDRTNPYPPTYYPNTHDVREAIPLSFMGGPLTLSRDLTAPPRLPVLTLRDRVLVPNGPLEAETNVRITGSAGDYVDPWRHQGAERRPVRV